LRERSERAIRTIPNPDIRGRARKITKNDGGGNSKGEERERSERIWRLSNHAKGPFRKNNRRTFTDAGGDCHDEGGNCKERVAVRKAEGQIEKKSASPTHCESAKAGELVAQGGANVG